MIYQLNRPDIDTVVDYIQNLMEDDKIEVYEFGENCDLVLHIYNDEDDSIRIHTYQNGDAVDDTDYINLDDEKIIRQELERINEYRDFGTM